MSFNCSFRPSSIYVQIIKNTSQTQAQDTCVYFISLDSGLLLSRPYAQVNANSNANTTGSVRMRGASTSVVSTVMGTAASVSTNTNTGTDGVCSLRHLSRAGYWLRVLQHLAGSWHLRLPRAPVRVKDKDQSHSGL